MPATGSGRGAATYLAAAVAVAAVAAGGAWLVRAGGPDGAADGGAADAPEEPVDRWRVFAEAFPVSDGWLSGPYVLVPDPDSCFVAFGQDSTGTGMAPGYWRSTGDCTAAVDIGPSRGAPPPDGMPSEDRGIVLAAAPGRDGGYLAVHRHTFHGDAFAYQTRIVHVDPYAREPEHRLTHLAEFTTDTPKASHIGPVALVATGAGYVAVGRDEAEAVAWTSADGAAWRRVSLPDDGLGSQPRVSAITEGPGGTLVAVGSGGTSAASDRPAGWISTDGGEGWRQVQMPDGGPRPSLTTVLHDGEQFVALGGQSNNVREPALVLTSPDGVEWIRDDSLAGAGGGRVKTATVLPDGQVLAVTGTGESGSGPDQQCAAAWRRAPAGWTAEDLGCQGVPTSLAVLADGTVAGVHWSTLFLRHPAAS